MKYNVVNILGTLISRLSLIEISHILLNTILHGEKHQVCVLPVNNILWAHKSKRLSEIYKNCLICTSDGVPVVWASKLLGKPIDGRSTGYDLLPQLCDKARHYSIRMFFLGGAPGVAELAAENLKTMYPGLEIAGSYSPPYKEKFSVEDNDLMINLINNSGAQVLWVAMTAPKQDIWIASVLNKLNVNVAIGIGAALDVAAGKFKRPPKWIQNNGLEWLYRLLQEPKRLYRRYLIEAPIFIPLVLRQAFYERLLKRKIYE